MKKQITLREFFQKHYIDSGAIPQSFIDTYKGKVKGKKPIDVPLACVGDLTFEVNARTPEANDVMDYIRKEGGLSWYLLGALQLARLLGNIMDIADGLHRAIAVCIVEGTEAMVPVNTTEFDHISEAHGVFWKKHSRAKSVNNQANHVAQVRSGDMEKDNNTLHIICKQLGDTVVYSNCNRYEPVANKLEWSIMVGPFKQIFKDVKKDTSTVIKAIEIYQKTFAEELSGNGRPVQITGQIYQAMAYLLKVNQPWLTESCKGKTNLEHFEDYLVNLGRVQTRKETWYYRHCMADRMEKKYQGTAYGIWQEFVSYFKKLYRGKNTASMKAIEKDLDGKIYFKPEDEDQDASKKAA